ncbi:MAG TPA: hydroxymethylglutaryl-CoA reductase (NADPH) [Thermoanaerobaculia bacterium]|nr:hydroxymethylglutaryl-CoA reductase (NADPH) [Thermoanaerobaculia bacterium]
MMEKTPVPERETDVHEELVEELVRGERRFHALPKDLPADEAARVRREALERIGGGSMEHTGSYTLDAERAAYRNCENFIGVTQIPVGVIGPLRLKGEHVEGDVYVPLATTEAALVASTNRGCAAIREAGGATVRVEEAGMTRAPAFRTSGVDQTRRFLAWVNEHEDEIRAITEGTSRFLKLLDIRPFHFGTSVFLRFRFDSGDAMGMNMATIACDRVVTEYIEPETGIECIALSGNYCVDKKPAEINFQEGRGKRVRAEVVLEAPILKRYLKTTARDLVEAQYRKNLLGSIAAGSMGFNAHYANVLSAAFIALGQDPAHVVEGSLGVTCIEPRGPEAVYASIFLPDLPVGAIGGGTNLSTQSEALQLLGIEPDPQRPGAAARRLAEIIGGAVLAGEISLMAAFTSQDLARAHERLGRGQLPPGIPGSNGSGA